MRQLKIIKQITERESFSIEKYLQEIGKFPILTLEEEVVLAKQLRGGNESARERLVLGNLRFVVSVAKQYQNYGLALGDLINEGNLGLIKAAECFDETKGFKFISYAVWWIRQSILQAIAEHARVVRLPSNKINAINKVNREYLKLLQEFQREPTVEEIAERADLSMEEVKECLKVAHKAISMDAPLTMEEENMTMYDVFVAKDVESDIEKVMNISSLRTEIDRSLAFLPEKEALILRYYYGLGGYPMLSLSEIGLRIGLTSERVRQIKTRAIKRLKNNYRNKQLRNFL